MLTIITVVRNDVDGLVTTLASIAGQANGVDQVVVVDGSDDKAAVPSAMSGVASLSVTYSWAEPRGVYAAMNDGLALATNEYVYFLNAGDTLHDDEVMTDMTAALDAGRPRWVVGRVEFRATDGRVLPEPEWNYDAERAALFARGRFPAHQGVVVRTEELRGQGGFDTSYTVTADYLSILKLARGGPPVELDRVLAVFTVGGLSTQSWRRGLHEFHQARTEVFAPSGLAAIRERAYTVRTWLTTTAYRELWAPGRPLAGLAARLKGQPDQ